VLSEPYCNRGNPNFGVMVLRNVSASANATKKPRPDKVKEPPGNLG